MEIEFSDIKSQPKTVGLRRRCFMSAKADYFWLRLYIAVFLSLLALILPGCGNKIQSDLQLEGARFTVDERRKSQFVGSVRNTGSKTYKSVFIVVDAFKNDEIVAQISTTADLRGQNTLGPGGTTSFSKGYEDGGAQPNRFEVVRLYGVE